MKNLPNEVTTNCLKIMKEHSSEIDKILCQNLTIKKILQSSYMNLEGVGASAVITFMNTPF